MTQCRSPQPACDVTAAGCLVPAGEVTVLFQGHRQENLYVVGRDTGFDDKVFERQEPLQHFFG